MRFARFHLSAGIARPALLGLSFALLLSACSTPAPVRPPVVTPPPVVVKEPPPPVVTPKQAAAREMLTRLVAMQDRLYRVASPLLINNPDLCKNQARNLLGFTAKNKYSYTSEFVDAAHHGLGLNDRLEVTSVLAGSGAARAGLRRGDTLLSAEGKALPSGPNAQSAAAGVFGPLVGSNATIKMAILRKGDDQTLNVPVTRACAFQVELGNSDNVNSYADGQRILLTRGLVNYAQSDEDLAYVIAKGMAHNILGHA